MNDSLTLLCLVWVWEGGHALEYSIVMALIIMIVLLVLVGNKNSPR